MTVASQAARIRRPSVGEWRSAIRSDYVEIEIHHALAGNRGLPVSHSVRRVADRAGEAVVNVACVLAETGTAHDTG